MFMDLPVNREEPENLLLTFLIKGFPYHWFVSLLNVRVCAKTHRGRFFTTTISENIIT